MSAPTQTHELIGTFEELPTADAIAVGRILSDNEIIVSLEGQFSSDITQSAADVAAGHLLAGIDAAYPEAETDPEVLGKIARAGKFTPGNYEHLDATIPPSVEESALEEGIGYTNREFTAEENKVVLAALRKAARTPGYRMHASDILAERAPSPRERLRHRATMKLGKFYMNIWGNHRFGKKDHRI